MVSAGGRSVARGARPGPGAGPPPAVSMATALCGGRRARCALIGGRWRREGAASVGATAAGAERPRPMERGQRQRQRRLRPGAVPGPPLGLRRPPPEESRGPPELLHIKVEEPEAEEGDGPACCGDSRGSAGEFRRSPSPWWGKEGSRVVTKRERDHERGSGENQSEVKVLENRGDGKESWRAAAAKAEPPPAAFEVKLEKDDGPAGSPCGPVQPSPTDRKAQLCQGFGILPEDLKLPVVFRPLPPGTRIQIQGPLPPDLIHVTKVPVKQVPLKMQSLLEPSVKIETKNVPLTVLPSDSGILLRKLARVQ